MKILTKFLILSPKLGLFYFSFIMHLYRTLHAICILLKPNESRLSAGFRRALDYFLVRFHASAQNNILFCFTNTRSTMYRPGDTIKTVQRYFEELEKRRNIRMTLNKYGLVS